MTSNTLTLKVAFWISTFLVAFALISSGFMVNDPKTIELFNHLGVGANWFRIELEIGKALGGIVLLIPFIRGRVKEWVYAFVALDFVSAVIAVSVVDGFAAGAPILLFVAVLAVSYITYHKLNHQKMPLI
ncbi:DoxX family protein [Candidatus Gracilibacteria bacterium]|nr:DoxX family protein [Candidatus Gracilibacteria bacterium]